MPIKNANLTAANLEGADCWYCQFKANLTQVFAVMLANTNQQVLTLVVLLYSAEMQVLLWLMPTSVGLNCQG